MIPVVGMFRGLFLGSVLVWYSGTVWKTMDNYYNQEFKKYLQKEKHERRFPSEEVCRAVPDAPCTSTDAAADDDARSAVLGDAAARGGGQEALEPITAPESESGASGEDGGGGGGGCTVNRDVTHTGEWRRRAQEEVGVEPTWGSEREDGICTLTEVEDKEGTCPVQY